MKRSGSSQPANHQASHSNGNHGFSSIHGDEQLYDNAIYTAITRSKENLIIINANARYWEFGKSFSDEWR
ncbi:MAG: hypothetical protein NVS4B11_19090 [Ktedonobacteraceae bacterium]